MLAPTKRYFDLPHLPKFLTHLPIIQGAISERNARVIREYDRNIREPKRISFYCGDKCGNILDYTVPSYEGRHIVPYDKVIYVSCMYHKNVDMMKFTLAKYLLQTGVKDVDNLMLSTVLEILVSSRCIYERE